MKDIQIDRERIPDGTYYACVTSIRNLKTGKVTLRLKVFLNSFLHGSCSLKGLSRKDLSWFMTLTGAFPPGKVVSLDSLKATKFQVTLSRHHIFPGKKVLEPRFPFDFDSEEEE